ncbi:MAG: GNAT family N-acetyltransferase [Chloroflexota bacterium]
MKITDHAYRNTDAEYNLIKALLLDIETYPNVDNNWEPGRMNGWRFNAHVEKGIDFFQTHAHYWKTEANQVVGLFISEYAQDDFFLVVHPRFWDLAPEVLAWGIKTWAKEKPKMSTEVYSFGDQKIELLLAAGFYEDGHIENVRTYRLDGYDFAYELKPGFSLMSFAEYGNVESRIKLVQNAFDNPNYSETRYRSIQNSPGYRPELDLVIVNPEGESVGYCMGWVEENNSGVGFIEPMGVHSDYRRRGFGKILAKACFKRLHALGVDRAWIASLAEPNVSNFLYESLDPVSIKRSYSYALNLRA